MVLLGEAASWRSRSKGRGHGTMGGRRVCRRVDREDRATARRIVSRIHDHQLDGFEA